MIAIRAVDPENVARDHQTANEPRCWCRQDAEYTLELVNARIGTGRFQRCRQHARWDLGTGDFRVVEAWI